MKIKRYINLEYRIRKLEKIVLEDIDSDLDKMSDDILKRMPNDDLDAELDKKAKDIVDKEPGYFYHADEYGDHPKTFNTIDEWLDDKVIDTELNPELIHGGDVIKRLNGSIKAITNIFDGLDVVRYLKKKIKEISDMNVLVAQQKLVNALRKRIKDIKNRKQLENLTYEGKQDQDILNGFLGDDYYNKYQAIKNKISDPEYKDIYKLIKKDPDEVKNYIDNFKSSRDKRAASKQIGARKVYEDSDWIVYHITNYNAAKYYGRDTKWCLSGNYEGLEEVGQHEFEKYNSKSNIYFYINKHKAREKYAILKNRHTDRITDIYDSADHNLGSSAYYIDADLPYVKEIGLNTAEQEDLLFAIKDGDLETVKQCVNDNTINAVTPTGRTPLMIAVAKSGNTAIEIVLYLIDNGADVSYVSKDGKSALVIASESGNYEMVKLLVEYGHADVNNPMTEYGSAAYLGTDNEDIEEYLISKGAKID